MELKTKQQLKDEGFKFIATRKDNMEVWARFTGWQDCIQYIDYKEGIYTGDIQIINFNKVCLMAHMYKSLGEEYIKQNIGEKAEDSMKWKNEFGSY